MDDYCQGVESVQSVCLFLSNRIIFGLVKLSMLSDLMECVRGCFYRNDLCKILLKFSFVFSY